MKNNNEKQDETATAGLPPNNKPLKFTVTFTALRSYSGELKTPETESQDIFAQSYVFTDNIFGAIHRLTYEIQSIGENNTAALETIRHCEILALIGRAFAQEMAEQYDESMGIWGIKFDEK